MPLEISGPNGPCGNPGGLDGLLAIAGSDLTWFDEVHSRSGETVGNWV